MKDSVEELRDAVTRALISLDNNARCNAAPFCDGVTIIDNQCESRATHEGTHSGCGFIAPLCASHAAQSAQRAHCDGCGYTGPLTIVELW